MMFSKTIVAVFLLANIFHAQCRPDAVFGPEVDQEKLKTLFGNPDFNGYLQQLLTYFSSLQGQGQTSSQVFQSQQSSSQSSSQQGSAISHDSVGAATTINQSQQPLAAVSVAQSEGSQSSHSSASSVAQDESIIQSRNKQHSLVDESIFHQNADNPVSNQIANLLQKNSAAHEIQKTSTSQKVHQSTFHEHNSAAELAQKELQSNFGKQLAQHSAVHGQSESTTTHSQQSESNIKQSESHYQHNVESQETQKKNIAAEQSEILKKIHQNAASHLAHTHGHSSNVHNTIFQEGKHIQEGEYNYNSEEERIRALNAKFHFATLVDDNINGNFQLREESREGGKVIGKYAYDDGNIMRIVFYVADDKGFRIVKEEILPSGKAVANLDGHAYVKTYLNGDVLDYQISESDIHGFKHLGRADKVVHNVQL